ncbi:MAG: 30S ribosome-binding factor RbfA [Elusimicrobia bacterium]|nr:30S ribosome-binding factor RbfA [Elusimicrobiota bacterium]MBI2915903.1 30S ribosome-binding factor RbfA [Elusimicrobiota bacterium]MBI3012440.1 30S ribosome-binding factor RbfA [Elusimicrobiota bacterium]MBI4218214.1 30S ribosome-binding factor RbfA [Elusimicrobiota bacterium]
MSFKRSERVSELLRHEISQLVQQIKDPRLGFVTITEVTIGRDLSDAKVFYSVFGSEEEKKVAAEILASTVHSMRKILGRKLESLRKVPALTFVYDKSPERAQRVSALLEQLSKERDDAAQTE